MPSPVLEVEGLSAQYGEAQALRDVSLHVGKGELVTLVGRNGAGKTTLLRCVMGLHRQSNGWIGLNGRTAMSCCNLSLKTATVADCCAAMFLLSVGSDLKSYSSGLGASM